MPSRCFLFSFSLFPSPFLVYHLARFFKEVMRPFLYLMRKLGSVRTDYHDTYAYTHTHTSGEADYGPQLIILYFYFTLLLPSFWLLCIGEWANYIMSYMFFLLE